MLFLLGEPVMLFLSGEADPIEALSDVPGSALSSLSFISYVLVSSTAAYF
jgi:hypothetical protein